MKSFIFGAFIICLVLLMACRKDKVLPHYSAAKSIDTFILKQADNGFLFETDTVGLIGPDTIKLTLPGGTSLTQLVPTIAFTGKTLMPASGTPQDFTKPVKYVVTDSAGGTRDYIVQITLTGNNELLVNSQRVWALDLGTGSARWINEVSWNASLQSSAVTGGNLVFSGGSDGNFYATDYITGTSKWTQKIANLYFYSPAFSNGTVYAGCGNGNLYAMDARTGSIVWTKSFGAYGVFSIPVISNNSLLIQCNDSLYDLNASNGNLLWISSVSVSFNNTPLVRDNAVFIAGSDSSMYSIDLTNGIVNWKTNLGCSTTTADAANNLLYMGGSNDTLYALNASTGARVWAVYADVGPSNPYISYSGIQSNALVQNGVVYIGGGDPNLYAFDAATGTLIWTCNLSNQVISGITGINGMLYVGNYDNNVYAIDAQTGHIKWNQLLGGPVAQRSMSPCVIAKDGSIHNPVN